MSAPAPSLLTELTDPATPAAAPQTETASRTRAEINRANAQHSSGPRTPEGKARASMNAVKHGIFSAEVPLPGEDPAIFESLSAEYARDFHAATEQELSLVQEIVACRWRMQRIVAREAALTILTTEQQRATVEKMFDADDDTITSLAQAAGFQANARLFNQLSIAEARLYRRADLAGKKLSELVHNRRMSALIQPVQLPVEPAAQPAAPPIAVPSGFVPPHSPEPAFPSNMPVFTGPLKKENRRQWLRKHGYHQLAKAV
jgi:hypothetical protein